MKTIVITGANKGVGLTLVKHFISDFKVVALSKSYDNLINVKSDNLTFHCVDVSDLSRMKDVFKSITNIDYLINCAAVFESQTLLKQSFDKIEEIIDVNLKGTLFSTKLTLDKMKKGRIINISSVSGLHGIENQSVYSSTKHSLNGLQESLNFELIKKGIQVTNINPGGINTPLWNKNNPYKGDVNKLLTPEDILKTVKFILDFRENVVIKNITLFPDNEIH